MSRYVRMDYKGGLYHVIARGNNKEYIFKESIDRGYFIKQIKECKKGMGFFLYAYVMMDNHYHILIQTMDKRLQEIMHQLNMTYSKYFNYKYERVGHVFQGRYKAILVQDERYLLSLIRYIHQNPVRAYICNDVEDYKWSSDVFYRKQIDAFIDTSVVFDMLSTVKNEALARYIELMDIRDEEEKKRFEETNIIGDDAYLAMMGTRRQKVEKTRLDEILISTGVSNEEFELIKGGARNRYLTEYKQKYISAALMLKYTYKEIGENISITDTSVRGLIESKRS